MYSVIIILIIIAIILSRFDSWSQRIKRQGLDMVVGITPLLFLSFFFSYVLRILFLSSFDLIYSIGIGIIIASTIYFNSIFPYCAADVPDSESWVTSNKLKNESLDIGTNELGQAKTIALKEITSGYNWLRFWAKPVLGVDLTRAIQITNDPDETVTLGDGNIVIVDYRLDLTPLRGAVVNLIKSRPIVTRGIMKDRVKAWLGREFGKRKTEDVDYGGIQAELRDSFQKIFGGPQTLDPLEEQLGVWTNTPEILRVRPATEAQQVTAFLKAVEAEVTNSQRTNPSNPLTRKEAIELLIAQGIRPGNVDLVRLQAGVK